MFGYDHNLESFVWLGSKMHNVEYKFIWTQSIDCALYRAHTEDNVKHWIPFKSSL